MNYDVNAVYGQNKFHLRHLPQAVHQAVCESFLTVAAVDDLKRHGLFMAFNFYCKIMLHGINYTYYSIKTVKICFHVPFRG